MRLIMMATGEFAAPTLQALVASRHEVVLLITRPTRPTRGHSTRSEKGRPAPANPSAETAAALGLEVWAPETINDPAACEKLDGFNADLLVVCDYGEILKPLVLSQTRLGGINLHASLLPKYRGAAPINWAIYHGEQETGNTVFQLTPGMDSGPILSQNRTPIGPDETAAELKQQLAELGARLVLQVVDDLESGTAQPTSQDAARATRAPRLQKNDGAVDWTRTAQQIKDQVRAFKPWPATYTLWQRPGKPPLRIILDWVEPVENPDLSTNSQDARPGQVVEADKRLIVATGGGLISLERVQPAGKRAMQAAEFLRGHNVRSGEMFSAE